MSSVNQTTSPNTGTTAAVRSTEFPVSTAAGPTTDSANGTSEPATTVIEPATSTDGGVTNISVPTSLHTSHVSSGTSQNVNPGQTTSGPKPITTIPSSPGTSNLQSTTLRTHTAATRASATQSPTTGKDCKEPPTIQNGFIASSGPYSPGKTAQYVCTTGFTLSGPAVVKCGIDLAWPPGPTCLPFPTAGHGNSNIYLSDTLPLWLAVVLGMTFAVICLILLFCLLVACLRIFGCWKRPLLGENQSASYAAPASGGSRVSPGPTVVGKSTGVSYIELEPFDDYQTGTSGGQPPADSRYYFANSNNNGNSNSSTNRRDQPRRGNRFVDETNSHADERKPPARKAKRPSKPTWMPHAQKKRNLNTSTM